MTQFAIQFVSTFDSVDFSNKLLVYNLFIELISYRTYKITIQIIQTSWDTRNALFLYYNFDGRIEYI